MEEVVQASREERRRRWQEHIERQKQSGLKVTAYCSANGLKAPQFWYWRHVLCTEQVGGAGFVELKENGKDDPGVTLVIRGVTIRIQEGFNPLLLRSVLACLGVS